jgi:hypothetical protein
MNDYKAHPNTRRNLLALSEWATVYEASVLMGIHYKKLHGWMSGAISKGWVERSDKVQGRDGHWCYKYRRTDLGTEVMDARVSDEWMHKRDRLPMTQEERSAATRLQHERKFGVPIGAERSLPGVWPWKYNGLVHGELSTENHNA